MALINCDFFSESLGMQSSITVILPQQTGKDMIGMAGSVKKERYPVLYLLHGLSDDHSIWLRRTSIERYVSALGLAVVMPNAHRSFYTDMQAGGKYFTYISSELPSICQAFFPISGEREDNFIAGLSMGGYGAFKIALSCPQRFCAAASLSGVLDIAIKSPTWPELFDGIFGKDQELTGSKHDLFALADKLAAVPRESRPELFQSCGTEDFLYADNVKFCEHLRRIGYQHEYREKPGTHCWEFWDDTIQDVLKWLPLKK
ncbi:MAG: esterase family protein [Victivallales bacterium]|nr:esterase family protein [Victivallales bacterium]